MSILEDNKLIAKWLNITLSHTGEHDFRKEYFGKPYQPHKDWNQLMEVVEKIKKEARFIRIIGPIHTEQGEIMRCQIYSPDESLYPKPPRIYKDAPETKEAVFQAVLEYIKSKEA